MAEQVSNPSKGSGVNAWFAVGAILTAIWIAFIVWLIFTDSSLVKRADSLTLNEIGDFLAGAAAPLAFLWLLVAVMVQRAELMLQRVELQDTREVLRAQAAEARRQAEYIFQQTKIMEDQHRRVAVDETGEHFLAEVASFGEWLAARFKGNFELHRGESLIRRAKVIEELSAMHSNEKARLLGERLRAITEVMGSPSEWPSLKLSGIKPTTLQSLRVRAAIPSRFSSEVLPPSSLPLFRALYLAELVSAMETLCDFSAEQVSKVAQRRSCSMAIIRECGIGIFDVYVNPQSSNRLKMLYT